MGEKIVKLHHGICGRIILALSNTPGPILLSVSEDTLRNPLLPVGLRPVIYSRDHHDHICDKKPSSEIVHDTTKGSVNPVIDHSRYCKDGAHIVVFLILLEYGLTDEGVIPVYVATCETSSDVAEVSKTSGKDVKDCK